MRKIPTWILSLLFVCLGHSCTQTDESSLYPSLITEFSELYADADGNLYRIRPDRKPSYYLSTPLPGYHPHTEYRAACTYSYSENDSSTVKLYGLERVVVLQDSTQQTYAGKDPLQVISLWDGGEFINLHLVVKTQNKTHYLGYRLDSVRIDSQQKRTAYLSLYHNQNNNPLYYSQKLYASLSKSYLNAVIEAGDSIDLCIPTFEGKQHWKFIY